MKNISVVILTTYLYAKNGNNSRFIEEITTKTVKRTISDYNVPSKMVKSTANSKNIYNNS